MEDILCIWNMDGRNIDGGINYYSRCPFVEPNPKFYDSVLTEGVEAGFQFFIWVTLALNSDVEVLPLLVAPSRGAILFIALIIEEVFVVYLSLWREAVSGWCFVIAFGYHKEDLM
jgi:hypothetical protein